MKTTTDEKYMRRALSLARKGLGRTSPNPMVGAVLVRAGRAVGEGYHHRAGEPHAEVLALRMAGKKARGATLYLNLEPCNHFGRTPPCTEAVLKAGVKRVVVGMKDPNPLVAGRGIKRLRKAGVVVDVGVLEEACRELNAPFSKYITQGKPYVTLKAALTLDGKIATGSGDSRWISSAASRNYVHALRRNIDAILVGIGTVLKDDPLLTARPEGKTVSKQPLRIVADSRLRISLHSQILRTASRYPTLIATTAAAPPGKIRRIQATKAAVWVLPKDPQGKVNLARLLKELGRQGIVSLLLEGGAGLNASALQSRLVDRILFFVSPKIVGGVKAPGAVGGQGVSRLRDAWLVDRLQARRIGPDLVIEGLLKGKE